MWADILAGVELIENPRKRNGVVVDEWTVRGWLIEARALGPLSLIRSVKDLSLPKIPTRFPRSLLCGLLYFPRFLSFMWLRVIFISLCALLSMTKASGFSVLPQQVDRLH